MKLLKSTFILFCLCWVFPVHTSEKKTSPPEEMKTPLKISIMAESPPFSMLLPDGTPTGLYVEFWQLWSKANKIPITFQASGFVENISDLKNHKVDFHSGLFKNEERLQWADFSLPVHKVPTGLFFATTETFTLSEMEGKKIGVGTHTFQESFLRINYPDIEVYSFDKVQDTINALLDKKINAIFSEVPYLRAELGRMGIQGALTLSQEEFITNTVHAVIPKGNPELVKIINTGINNIPLYELIKLEKKWIPKGTPFFSTQVINKISTLTLEQQQWLKTNSSFSLGIDPAWSPFEFIDDDQQYAGISSDYIKSISEKLNLKMVAKNELSWVEVIENITAGKIDVLPAVVKTENREKFLNFTEPYISFPLIITTRKDAVFIQNLEELNNHKVGVVKSYITHELLQQDFPEIQLEYFDTVHQGLIQLEKGDITAFVENLGVITHEINKHNFNELKIAAITPYKLELAMGIRKGLEPLVPILNKALNSMSSKEKASIANSWLSYQLNLGINLTTFLLWAAPLIGLLSLIILYVVRSNRRLQFEINGRKKIEKSLERAKHSAEAANLAKDDFLANMSHEIRTPMNAVVGMSHLLKQSGLNSEQQEYINTLNKSASSLLLLIDDILDLSKVESGKIELESIPFDLKTLLSDINTQTILKIDPDKIQLKLEYSEQIPKIIYGDPLRLGQIINNLCNNAVKFTQQGEICLKVEVSSITAENIVLHFTLTDTGIGLTAEQQRRLFQTYSQADSSTSRKYGGTGLGLAICKNLCEIMQGKIWVESQINQGSSFHFTASFNRLNEVDSLINEIDSLVKKPVNSIDLTPLKNKQILLVDDNEVNLTIASKILTTAGIQLELARNGKQALEMLAGKHFDAVLMDIQMPLMDGYAATEQIRQLPEFTTLPVIAMSANVMQSDIQKALNAGMNAHIAKPLQVDTMMKTLLKFI